MCIAGYCLHFSFKHTLSVLPYYKLDALFRSAADLGRTGETDEAIDSLVSPIRALK